MKKIFFLLFVSMIQLSYAYAQDIHFSQFYLSPLTENPAMAGAEHDLSTTLNYKSQWSSVAVPFNTMAFGFDMRLNKSHQSKGFLATGVNFFSDKSGDAKLATSQGNLLLAYHVHVNTNNTFGGGVSAGFGQRAINFSGLKWGTQYDGTMYNSTLLSGEPATGTSSLSYLDIGGGLDWNFDDRSGSNNVTANHDRRFNIGLGVWHVNQPKYSFYGSSEKLYMKYVVHGTGTFSIASSNVAFCPGFMYSRQGPSQEIYAGGLIRFVLAQDSKYTGFKQGAAISFGAFVRAQDAVAATVLLDYANYSIGMSYDVNTSGLTAASNAKGGFEVAVRFVTPNPFAAKSSSSFFN